MAGERDDSRGGRDRGIVVEIRCKGQGVDSAIRMIEGASLGSARMLVEVAHRSGMRPCRLVGSAKQEIEATLELTVSKVINGVHGIFRRVSPALLLTNKRVRMPSTANVTPSDLPAA